MKFKEEFPSLKEKEITIKSYRAGYLKDVRTPKEDEPTGTFEKEDIQKHCIDKERVRDALEVLRSIANMIPDDLLCNAGRNEKMYLKKTLYATIDLKKKELGLEE